MHKAIYSNVCTTFHTHLHTRYSLALEVNGIHIRYRRIMSEQDRKNTHSANTSGILRPRQLTDLSNQSNEAVGRATFPGRMLVFLLHSGITSLAALWMTGMINSSS